MTTGNGRNPATDRTRDSACKDILGWWGKNVRGIFLFQMQKAYK